jgi:hypothetical protein
MDRLLLNIGNLRILLLGERMFIRICADKGSDCNDLIPDSRYSEETLSGKTGINTPDIDAYRIKFSGKADLAVSPVGVIRGKYSVARAGTSQ